MFVILVFELFFLSGIKNGILNSFVGANLHIKYITGIPFVSEKEIPNVREVTTVFQHTDVLLSLILGIIKQKEKLQVRNLYIFFISFISNHFNHWNKYKPFNNKNNIFAESHI